jgi:WD40 repeat protein/serine/threonine protein kinase
MDNLTGQSIERYHILEQLGEGGMAVVYKAFDTRLETNVAIKVIRTERLAPEIAERALKRFEREAKSLAQLNHPNIVKVTDYGDYDGKPYLVMPYLEGGTLKEVLHSRGRFPWQEAVRLILPIMHALEYAHQRNTIHRDVKPSNILITDSGEPVLSDFGVAKIIDDESTLDLTGTSATVGTPEYMAPEQVISKSVDFRVDIYSLGVVLYEMLTGRKPFQADTPMAVLFKHASEALPRPKQFAPDLPERVEKTLVKALAKKPEDRYQSMTEFRTALEGLPAGPEKVSLKGRTGSAEKYRPDKNIEIDAFRNPEENTKTRRTGAKKDEKAVNPEEERIMERPVLPVPPPAKKAGKESPDPSSHANKAGPGKPTSRAWVWISLASLAGIILLVVIGPGVMNRYENKPAATATATTLQVTDTLAVPEILPTWTAAMTTVKTVAPSPTPTSLPKLALPLLAGMQLPSGKKTISADNYQDLTELAIWGNGPINQVGWTPNNQYLAVGSSTGLSLYNPEGDTVVHFFPEENTKYIFSSDSSVMALVSENKSSLVVKSVVDGSTLSTITLPANDGTINCLAFSLDNKTLASGSSIGIISLWSVSDGINQKRFETPQSTITSLTFSRDGKVLAAGTSSTKTTGFTINLWNIAQATVDHTITKHQASISQLLYSPDGKILASNSDDGKIYIWQITGEVSLYYEITAYVDYAYRTIGCMSFSPDSSIFAYTNHHANGYSIWLIQASNGTQLKIIDGHTGAINSIMFSQDGKSLVSGSLDHTFRIWSVPDGSVVKAIENHSDHINTIAISPDGSTLASGSNDGSIRLWRIQNGTDFRTIQARSVPLILAFNPAGDLLACGFGDGWIDFFDTRNGSVAYSLQEQPVPIKLLQFSKDGSMLATANQNGAVRLWQLSDRRIISSVLAVAADTYAVSPDLTYVAANRYSTLNLWQMSDGNPAFIKKGQSNGVISMAFPPDGKTIVTGSADKSLMISSIPDGAVLASFIGSTVPSTIVISSDGTLSASEGNDTVDLWLNSTNTLLKTIALPTSNSTDYYIYKGKVYYYGKAGFSPVLAFSADGAYLAFGLNDGTIRIWGIP